MKAGIPKGVINILPGSGNEQYLYSLNRLFLVIPSLGKVLKDQRCEHFSPSLCASFASFYLAGELKLYDHSREKGAFVCPSACVDFCDYNIRNSCRQNYSQHV